MPSPQKRFISVAEAGRRLGRSPRTIHRLISNGTFTASEIPGCHPRLAVDEVESFVPARLRTVSLKDVVVRLVEPQPA